MTDTNNTRTIIELNLEQLMEFYIRCDLINATTTEQREAVLENMVKNRSVTRAYTTGRTKEQIIQDLQRHSNVGIIDEGGVRIAPKEDNSNDTIH